MRWVIVAATLLAVLGALLGVRKYQPEPHVFDEVAAYEVTPGRPLTVRVPAGVEEVVMTTWAVVAPGGRFDPIASYRYGIDTELYSEREAALRRDPYTLESRVSYDPTRPLALGEYCARMADAPDWLADPRTTRVSLTELGQTGGRAVVRVRADESQTRVLVRLTYLTPLTEFERDIRARTLRIERGRRMVLGRASLGFDDLPAPVRSRALSHWERRFPALGHEGNDYVSRTVLIGNKLPSVPAADAPPAELLLGPLHAVAINLLGAVKLRAHGQPGSVLSVAEGDKPAYTRPIGETGRVDLELREPGARTVSLGATRETKLRLSLSLAESAAQIGVAERPLEEQRVFVTPDIRVQRYLALDPDRPVVFRLAPGQDRLGLNVRALVAGTAAGSAASLTVRSADGPPFSLEPFATTLDASPYDLVGPDRVTVAENAIVTVPAGVTKLLVFGQRGTLVEGWVQEPGVSVDRVEPEYDVPLDEGVVWRHAPCVEKAAAAIRAENDAELDREARVARVEAPVRIESLRSTGPSVVERVAKPLGAPLTRVAFMPTTFTGAMSPAELWTLMPAEVLELEVPVEKTPSDAFSVLYRVPGERLGSDVGLEVDGHTEARSLLVTGTGELRASLPRGRHRVRVFGPEGLVAFAAAPRAAGGRAFRRQLVYELAPGRSLELEVSRAEDELLAVFAEVVRETGPGTVRLSYAIDPKRPPTPSTRLYRRLTSPKGELVVDAPEAERALLWEAERPKAGASLSSAVGKLRIVLGDDLAPGKHVLRLSSPPDAPPLWVRAVVAGRRLAAEREPREEARP